MTVATATVRGPTQTSERALAPDLPASVALFAVGVWLLTAVLAYAQQRAGQRGPAEWPLRRLVYGSRKA